MYSEYSQSTEVDINEIYDLNRKIKRNIQGYNRHQTEQQMYIEEGTRLVHILSQ